MDTRRGIHHRLFSKRQGPGGVLGGLVPNDSESSSSSAQHGATSTTTGNPDGLGGIIGGFTSLIGDMLPSSGPSSTATSTTSLTLPSSSSTGSTTTSTSPVHTTTSTSTTISSSTLTTSTPTPTPTSTSSVLDTVFTSSEGTSVVYVTSTLPAASATPPHSSFLQNPSLEGGVFTLVGIVVLIIIIIVVTWTLRKRRRDRLERDLATAITFDPGAMDHYERHESSIEKHRLSGSSSGHGHGYGYGMQLAYAPSQEYHGPSGYGQYQYPAAAYRTPSPNPAPYQAPSPAVPQPAGQGGTNLTRKFSDRKPVPPLLPNPARNPSNTHVSIPPQFYHQ